MSSSTRNTSTSSETDSNHGEEFTDQIRRPENRLQKTFLHLIVAFWLIAICFGLGILERYSNTPGKVTAPPTTWPDKSLLTLNDDNPTLLVFAHPRCPCTEATLKELKLFIARYRGQIKAYVLFIIPEGVGPEWLNSDLWSLATRIPDVHIIADTNGLETERFHAETSGQTLYYNTKGKLLFSGGITLARGHLGRNYGRNVITYLVTSVHEPFQRFNNANVFGCALKNCESDDLSEAKR